MKQITFALLMLFTTSITFAQKATDNFTGKWKSAEGTIIEITKSGAFFIGKPTGKNIVVLKNLTFQNGKWVGVLSNPLKNTTANCEAYLEGNKIKFVAKKGMMSKEIFWTKEN
jgi:hypothetical protein